MRVSVEVDKTLKDTEIVIRCKEVDQTIDSLISSLSLYGKKIVGKRDGESYLLPLRDILYFESVDRKTFAYTSTSVYEAEQRLYEIVDHLSGCGFVQATKSSVVNLYGIERLRPYVGGRLLATLSNQEQIVISRTYAKAIKRKIGM